MTRHLATSVSAPPLLGAAIGIGLSIGVASALLVAPALRAQESGAANSPAIAGVTTLDGLGDATQRAALRTLLADAAARGLPIAPLVTKVREGVTKHAAPDRIRVATEALVQRLQMAADALAPTRSTEELSAGADALQAGVPVATLRDMRRIWPAKPLTVPLGVLSEMIASGVSHASATRRVRELLVKGATSTQLAGLGTNVRADIQAGLAPDAAMELRSKGVLSLLFNQNQAAAIAAPPIRPGPKPPK